MRMQQPLAESDSPVHRRAAPAAARRVWLTAVTTVVTTVVTAGCAAENTVPLVDMAAWQRITAAEDPLGAHAPTNVSCAPTSTAVEMQDSGTVFEVNTNDCNYFVGRQPLRVALEADATVRIDLWHLGLFSAQPAVAHLAVLVDGQPLWEKTLAIPAEAATFTEEWEAKTDARLDAPVILHLHNHGTNSWRFRSLVVVDP